MNIAVVGATGLVGQQMLKVLEERNFPVDALYPVASERSEGMEVNFKGKKYKVMSASEAVSKAPHLALFSAGASVSKEWAPKFAEVGTFVVDNSSAWRYEPEIPLVVPEINSAAMDPAKRIIANPNCSTIQLVMVLAPLEKAFGLKRVVISTYQSITGTGQKAVAQMERERKGEKGEMAYPYQIDKNCIPQCDVFLDNGYTREEMKLVWETEKILNNHEVKLTATAVRVPVMGGHSEAVNIEFNNEFDLGQIRKLLSNTPGIVLQDNVTVNQYPMPFYANNKDEVFVGRLRRDESQPRTLNAWIVADNLRKGAATNAVQIAEKLNELGWLTQHKASAH